MGKLLFAMLGIAFSIQAQNSLPFAEEVKAIEIKYDTLWDASKETVVFTGSSSIRIWHDLQERFPDHQIVNSGFGGSQTSDLLGYSNELILRYRPKKVFIYEGDNDISAGKKTKEIIGDMVSLISKIRAGNATTEIVLIAAKPSIARWHLKRGYKRLNRRFKKLCRRDVQMNYADVWRPMLNGRAVKKDIFIEDGLHMNSKGYALWYEVIKNHME